MKILNLVYPERSIFKYKKVNFPDGQQDIIIEKFSNLPIGTFNTLPVDVAIYSRFNSFKDYELIAASAAALRRIGFKNIHLQIPYLLGSRSDRLFVKGGTSYLVDVVAPALNLLNFESIRTFDVHSDVAAACIKGLESIGNGNLVRFAINEGAIVGKGLDETILVSPDAGSLKKIYKIQEKFGFKNEPIVCSKYRDTDGKLSKTHVPANSDDLDKTALIIDDICDGGRTFINIAEAMRLNQWRGKIYLIVTHGIFSAGFEKLSDHLNGIFCTNSISDINHDTVKVQSKQNDPDFVKQLNVF